MILPKLDPKERRTFLIFSVVSVVDLVKSLQISKCTINPPLRESFKFRSLVSDFAALWLAVPPLLRSSY